jgi:hypothetical protein
VRQRSSHPFAVVVLLVAAALVGALAIVAIWANRQLLDTRGWVSVSDRMLESPQVRHRVAAFLAEELVAETEAQLSAAGEDEIAAEAVPQLRRRGPELAARAIATPRFRVVWQRANRTGQRALLRVLDEEGGSRSGAVVIDLTPALRELAESLSGTELARSLGAADLGSLVEPGAARIEVFEADELDRAQDAVRAIRQVPVPATLATVLLLALALLLGRTQLRRTILGVGLSLAAAGGLALLARLLAGHRIVDSLLDGSADREAAEAAWRIATSTVADLSLWAICLGGLTAVGAALAPLARRSVRGGAGG